MIGSSEDNVKAISMWGPEQKEKTVKANTIRKRTFPSIWPIILGMLGTVILPFTLLIPIIFIELHKHPNLIKDPTAFTQKITDDLSNNIVGISAAFFLTWLALLIPVWVTGRTYFGGWKNLVSWKFLWKRDLLIALAFAVSMRILEALANLVLIHGFHIDPTKLTNSGLLTSAGSKWFWVLGLVAAIGAPIVEELFFRGMSLRILSTKFGKKAGVIFSSILFGLAHVQSTVAGSIYMFASTFILGCFLSILFLKTGRLGTTVLSHGFFNASAVLLSL